MRAIRPFCDLSTGIRRSVCSLCSFYATGSVRTFPSRSLGLRIAVSPNGAFPRSVGTFSHSVRVPAPWRASLPPSQVPFGHLRSPIVSGTLCTPSTRYQPIRRRFPAPSAAFPRRPSVSPRSGQHSLCSAIPSAFSFSLPPHIFSIQFPFAPPFHRLLAPLVPPP